MSTWAEGWAITRTCPPPRTTPYGRYVHVGLPAQLGRHVIDERSIDSIPGLAATIAAPCVFLKALAPPEIVRTLLPDTWTIEPPVWLMTARLHELPSNADLPPGYSPSLAQAEALSVEVRDSHGEICATGRAAVVGAWCVFDRIVTAENHRRRGLGSYVMHLVRQRALELGADNGLLVATDEGRALYTRLGWALHGAVTSAVLRPS